MMSAAPSLIPVAAAVLVAGLMAVAPDARSASAQHDGWYDGGNRGQYIPWIRGNSGNYNESYKKDKKKGPRNGPVVVPEPPMIALLGAGLLVLGFVAWRNHRKG